MTSPEDPKKPEDLEFEPVQRDSRFLVRLVLLLIVGAIAGVYLGGKLKNSAAGCGTRLLSPGESVIPPAAADAGARPR